MYNQNKLENYYNLLTKQLEALFFISHEDSYLIDKYKNQINKRFLFNCSNLKNKYYQNLSPYHSTTYIMFLYFVSNTIFKNIGRCEICDKVYNLSKIVSSADIYYEINLPDIFMLDHISGTVLGRAKYSNYFTFSQGITVGNNKGIYPEFGKYVLMCSNSKVLGNSKIGNNVIISANTYIKDTDIPDNSLVFGNARDKTLIVKSVDTKPYFENIFI